MSNYAHGEETYLATIASYYGSITSNVEQIAIDKGFVTRHGTVNLNMLADHSGISTSTLWYLLRDKKHFRALNLVTLAKLCFTLGVQPGDLFSYVPGGASNGLGYSSDAFTRLMGTQHRSSDGAAPLGSDEVGDGGDSERGAPDLVDAVSGQHGR
jgi:DNA-binding Xre family transcriptional regulator